MSVNLTFEEVRDLMEKQCDELTLCELLGIAPRDILEAFGDRLEARFSYIVSQLDTSALEEIERTSN